MKTTGQLINELGKCNTKSETSTEKELKELKKLVKTYLDKRDELHSQNNGMNFTSKLIITELENELKEKINV